MDLHGHRVTFRDAGAGPVIVLLHGIAGSSRTWDDVIERLTPHARVIAPDLLGHGTSAKPRGDYSLGSFASGVRDLIVALEVDTVTLVGHSLGGGVALQFAYQFPQLTGRLALVASGGLGREVSALLRACALPGAEFVLPLVANEPLRRAGRAVGRLAERLGYEPSPGAREIGRSYEALAATDARAAFVHTLRGVIDARGQRGDATDRLYLAEELPTMIIWGEQDRIIPVDHAYETADAIPGSRLEILPEAGHFPQRDDPDRVAELLLDHLRSTAPAENDARDLRDLVLDRGGFIDGAEADEVAPGPDAPRVGPPG